MQSTNIFNYISHLKIFPDGMYDYMSDNFYILSYEIMMPTFNGNEVNTVTYSLPL